MRLAEYVLAETAMPHAAASPIKKRTEEIRILRAVYTVGERARGSGRMRGRRRREYRRESQEQ